METPFGPITARQSYDPEGCDLCGAPGCAPLCEACEDERWAFAPEGAEIIPLSPGERPAQLEREAA